MDDNLRHVQQTCSAYLNNMATLWKPGVKLTLIARMPDDSEQDFVLTSDKLPEAINVLKRRHMADLGRQDNTPPTGAQDKGAEGE